MSNPHKIALIGFSSFERATFESFFRLAARRPPGYVLVADAAQANLAVVNADDAPTLRAAVASKPCQHVMLIGATDGGTGWATQSRPLNLMKVLTTVEQLLNGGAEPAVAAAPRASTPVRATPAPVAAATTAPAARPVTAAPAAVPASMSAPVMARSPVAQVAQVASVPAAFAARPTAAAPTPQRSRMNEVRMGAGDFANSRAETPVFGAPTRPASVEEDTNVDHILVVDDSDIALKFMRNRLTRFGFRTDLVNSGEEALGRMNVRPYKFVFLDVMMEGLDGYQTCRAIKQRKYAEGKPPVVVMLTSRGGTIDKIRGTLAGCDAYLTKPLNERDLIAVLAKHDRTVARGFQETNFGASAKSGFGGVSR
jgi:two-component system, cell cycle response regulator